MKNLTLVLLLLVLIFASGCGLITQKAAPAADMVAITPTDLPVVTQAPVLPTLTPAPAEPIAMPTPTEYVPVQATVLFDGMRLRVGPGFQFETLDYYTGNSSVTVLGRAPGDNWLFVQTPDENTGWMKIDGLTLTGVVYDIPLQAPEDAQVIRGHVYTTNGNPATELTVMANLDSDHIGEHQDVAVTDMFGQWFIYLPQDYSGEWRIEVNGYGCKSSAVNNSSSCSLLGNFPAPVIFTLPQLEDNWLEFQLLPF